MLQDGKFEIKLGLPSGNAFPIAPAPTEADMFYREDENRPYTYDGATWHGLAQLDVAETITADWTWGTDKKIFFRDAAIYIASLNDGFLDLVADTAIRLNADVGIGVTPQVELDINGSIRIMGITSPATGAGLEIQYSAGTSILFSYDRTGASYQPLSYYGSPHRFYIGNVGINVAPAAIFHVVALAEGAYGRFESSFINPGLFLYNTGAGGAEWQIITPRTGGLEPGGFVIYDNAVGRRLVIDTAGIVFPGGNKTQDFGKPATAWDDAYADDWHNVADFYFMDERKDKDGKLVPVDDLAVICAIKPSDKFDPRTGLRIIDDGSIPEWVFTRDKETGETLYDPDGKPYFSVKMLNSLNWGAIRQLEAENRELRAWVERLEAQIPA